MSTYEYTDICGEKLEVEHRPITGRVMVSAYTRDEADALVSVHVNVKPEDAPTLALAILEAAGIDPERADDTSYALKALRRHETARTHMDAEKAATRDWLSAFGPVREDYEVTPDDVVQWKRNRDYFAKIDAEIIPAEVIDDRDVIDYGGDEPPHDTKWRDTGGHVWSYGHTCHRDYPVWQFQSAVGSSFGRWTHLEACFFPMTRVRDE